jgi:PAS domain S-box-containing protein
MAFLEIRTILLGSILTNLIGTLIMVLLWTKNRKRCTGITFWILNFGFQTLTFILIAMRGQIPDLVSMVAANMFSAVGILLGLIGLERFLKQERSKIYNIILIVLFAIVHYWFSIVHPSLGIRNLNIAVYGLILCSQSAWLLLFKVKHRQRSLTRAMGFVFIGFCIVSAVRILNFFIAEQPESIYFNSGTFESLILLSYQMLFILLTYTLALMFIQRLSHDIIAEQEKFTKAFQTSPYIIIISRLSDGTILEVNDGFVAASGFTAEDVKTDSKIALSLWYSNETRAEVVKQLSEHGSIKEKELLFRTKTGQIITVLYSAEILQINNEKCILSVVNDITERKKAEEELRESQFTFSEMFHKSPVTIALTTPNEGRFLDINQTFLHATEYTRDEVIGHTTLELGVFGNLSERQYLIDILNKTGNISGYECCFYSKTGKFLTGIMSIVFIKVKGQICQLTTIVDISERKRIENTLRKNNSMLDLAMKAANMAWWEMDLDTGTVVFEKRKAEMLGYEPEKFRHYSDFMNLVHPDDYNSTMNAMIRHINGHSDKYEAEYRILTQKGEYKWFYDIGSITEKDAEGNPIKVIGLVIDISQRKKAEAEILNLNQTLENKVIERTAQLQAANRDLESFAYSVSHDLRAPLRHIDGFTNLIRNKMTGESDEVRHFLNVISTSAEKMGEMIDKLLNFSRLGRQALKISEIDLNELIPKIITQFETETKNQNIEWTIGKLPVISGDYQLLSLVFENLISNALKFTSKKEIAHIEINICDKNTEECTIFVKDNGVGFDPEFKDKLFGVFQRLHTTAEFEGIGIGLANVKQIIKKHGGDIWAEGKVNEGATVYIRL